jgi:hypothetical protein
MGANKRMSIAARSIEYVGPTAHLEVVSSRVIALDQPMSRPEQKA